MNRKKRSYALERVTTAIVVALVLSISTLVIFGVFVASKVISASKSTSPSAPMLVGVSAPVPLESDTIFPTPTPTTQLTSAEAEAVARTAALEARSLRAREILSGMTLREKVCQLFVVSPEAITGVTTVTVAGVDTERALEIYPVGGFLYSRQNLTSRAQVATMLRAVQSYAKVPLILTCDEEGGRVNRLMSSIGTTMVGPMLDYKDQGTDIAYSNADTIASDLRACGFNTDLAPVADVWSNPANTAIGDRAYSDDFSQAADLISAAVKGFHAGGVAATLKHFPGHGDTTSDSHDGAVYVDKTLEELRGAELVPFQAGIAAGADAVMVGHLIVSDIDSEPAPFSHKIVTGLLRDELGFDGVVITDGLQMKAMTDKYSSGTIAVKAVKAGVDLLLCPMDLDAAVSALTAAVESGEITEQRLDESVLRILELKLKNNIIPELQP